MLDIQGESFQELDDKSEQSIALGLAALAGVFALATFLVDRLQVAFVLGWGLVVTAGVFDPVALLLFIDAYLGLRPARGRAVVPALPWLYEKAGSEGWTMRDHYHSLLKDFPRCFSINQALIERKMARRRLGLHFLFLSFGCGATAFLYVRLNSMVA